MAFLDKLSITVKSGDGGNGATAFHREKYVPKGGPDGGDGGKGGDVVFVTDPRLMSLESLANRRRLVAQDGKPGRGSKCHGKNGQDLVIPVPPGTIIRDAVRGHVLKDLDGSGVSVVVATGGKGGRGNPHFASSVNRTPTRSEPGQPGEERALVLELKLIADVGLVGFPNAGKSSLLAALTQARPRIAAYPFTTLTPNLGIVEVDYEPYVIADVPGIIEGAHAGKGLGDQFLRHVERTRVLLHVVDASATGSLEDSWRVIRDEMAAYGGDLGNKPVVTAFNKMDRVDDRAAVEAAARVVGGSVHLVSAADGTGLEALLEDLVTLVREERRLAAERALLRRE